MENQERTKLKEDIKKELIADKDFNINKVSVGDLEITSSTENLKTCSNFIQGLLRDRVIKKYLGVTLRQKKLSGMY